MRELWKPYAFVFLALRSLADLTLSVFIYRQTESLVPAIGFLLICCVFYLFLYFGIRNEEFRGRYGRRVILWREPFAYWFVVAFLILIHLTVTVLMARAVIR